MNDGLINRVPKCDVTKILSIVLSKKLLEIACIDKFQLRLRTIDRNIGN